MEKNKLVCLADSVGTNYKMRVRTNTFSELLARRLDLEPHNYATPGAMSGYLLGYLKDNQEIIDNIKQAKIVLISCGTNNVLTKGLTIMGKAAGLDINSWRLLPKVVETIRSNPVKALQMVTALNSKDAIENINEGVQAYENDMPIIIEKIKQLNPDVIIMVVGIYTMSDISKSIVYKVTMASQNRIADGMNNWIKNNLPQQGVIVLDIAEKLRNYHGDKELSNLNQNDIHLSDEGHLFVYRNLYDLLIEHYPEMACEEGHHVINLRKLKAHEQVVVEETKNEKIIRNIITKAVNRDDFEYDINKQFDEMGVNLMEMLDIAKTIENECFDGHEVINLPAYNFPINTTPRFFVDMLDGKSKDSALLHLDELKHYDSLEEKQENEINDSEALKVLKKVTYEYLKDDMVVINPETKFFDDLKMNFIDFSKVIFALEIKRGNPIPLSRKPGYENLTYEQIAKAIE